MKYLYPLSLVLLLIVSCGKDDEKIIDREKSDWAFYKLAGDVKTVSEKSYATADGKQKGPTKQEMPSNHDRDFEFNDEGMLVREKTWASEGVPFEEIKYQNRESKLSHTQFVSGAPSLVTQYAWDEKGKNNLSVTRRNANNTPFDRIVMKYKKDRLIEKITYNAQENPTNKITYFYDQKGNVTGENFYYSSDVLQFKTNYTYNDKNQKVAETHYNKDGKVDYKTTYTYSGDKVVATETTNAAGDVSYIEKSAYDKDGNMVSNYTFDKFDGQHMRDEFKYDSKGNKTEWNVYKGDQLTMKAVYTFDKYGNPVKSMTTDAEGNVLESKAYKYEYDNQGNWVKRVLYLSNRPEIITERKITYHAEE